MIGVSSYEHLDACFRREMAAGKSVSNSFGPPYLIQYLRSIFLINCGGNMDLFGLFDLHENNNLSIYVVDTHRPYHSSNVKNMKNVNFLLPTLPNLPTDLLVG